jgi:hypothetical protein
MDDNKQYLLFLYDDFRGKDEVVKILTEQMSIFIAEGTFLKFNYGDFGIIFHFESPFSFIGLRENVQFIFDRVSYQYFLMEYPPNLHVFMPSDLKLNLFDLTSENNTKETNLGNENIHIFDKFMFHITSTFNPQDFIFEEEDSTIFTSIVQEVTEERNKPTVDELLEKILEKGIKSLSKYEKKLLDEYSKS